MTKKTPRQEFKEAITAFKQYMDNAIASDKPRNVLIPSDTAEKVVIGYEQHIAELERELAEEKAVSKKLAEWLAYIHDYFEDDETFKWQGFNGADTIQEDAIQSWLTQARKETEK